MSAQFKSGGGGPSTIGTSSHFLVRTELSRASAWPAISPDRSSVDRNVFLSLYRSPSLSCRDGEMPREPSELTVAWPQTCDGSARAWRRESDADLCRSTHGACLRRCSVTRSGPLGCEASVPDFRNPRDSQTGDGHGDESL